jgi:hypothetical protein
VVLVKAPSPGIGSFAIDATSVYWTTSWLDGSAAILASGTVSKCPIAGCSGAPTTLATGQQFPESIWVRGNALYWRDYNAASIMRCSVDCNDDPSTFLKWTTIGYAGFVPTETQVFFTGDPGSGLVEECPASGCSSPTTFASGQQAPDELAISGTDLYWLDLGTVLSMGKVVEYVDGGVMKCPLSGCADAAALATGLSYPSSLAVDGKNAYWAQENSVVACGVAGCNGAPSTVASVPGASGGVRGVAVDATDVYFGAVGGGAGALSWEIRRCAIAGCPGGSTLLSSTPIPSGGPVATIAVDAARVYFVSGDGLEILALAK